MRLWGLGQAERLSCFLPFGRWAAPEAAALTIHRSGSWLRSPSRPLLCPSKRALAGRTALSRFVEHVVVLPRPVVQLGLLFALVSTPLVAQDDSRKSYSEVTKGSVVGTGLFTVYYKKERVLLSL